MLKIILYIGMTSLLVGCHKFLPPSKENNLHRIEPTYQKNTLLQTNRNYDSTNKKSGFNDMAIGILLVVFSVALLWFNERRAVITSFRLNEIKNLCVETSSESLNKNLEGKLIYISGKAKTYEKLCDVSYGVVEDNAFLLERNCEMLQWIENSCKNNYKYEMEWRSQFVDSSYFRDQVGHYNDQSMFIIQSEQFLNPHVNVGAYEISEFQKSRLKNFVNLDLSQQNVNQAIITSGGKHKIIFQNGNYIYYQQNTNQAQAGDFRVSFQKIPCEHITIMSQQTQNTFEAFKITDKYDESQQNDGQERQGGCFGSQYCGIACALAKKFESPLEDVDWIYEKVITKNQIIQEKLNENMFQSIFTRLIGCCLVGAGINLFFSPITLIISYFPLFGKILAAISELIFILISFIISTIFSILTIAIAWIWYRPWVGITLLLVTAILSVLFYSYVQSLE